MTVETINQPMSDFAIKLANALKSIGHHYFGKINYEGLPIEEYLKLSPREMALRFAREHDLDAKRNIFTILRHIYSENKKDVYRISLREILDEKKMDYQLYSVALMRSGFLQKNGRRNSTEYRWIRKDAPVFSDAEEIYELLRQMQDYKLDDKTTQYIEDHCREDIEDLLKKLNPEDSDLKHYQIRRVQLYKRTVVSAREKKVNEIINARKIMDREISRKAPEISVTAEAQQEEEKVQQADEPGHLTEDQNTNQAAVAVEPKQQVKEKDTKKTLSHAEQDEQELLYLAEQRVKMYKKIAKIQDRMIRQYEKRLSQRK